MNLWPKISHVEGGGGGYAIYGPKSVASSVSSDDMKILSKKNLHNNCWKKMQEKGFSVVVTMKPLYSGHPL